MTQDSLTTPVLFLIFNRPDTTRIVFDEIRKAKPAHLFVAADGPRKDRPDDYENCRKVREIIQHVDWDCKVTTLFREENLGCKHAISSAINWFFSQVDEGIILEDDCFPDQSFFPYCQELLERYRDDERVMMISGDNFLFGRRQTEYSYYFSRYPLMWGWATWKRAWNNYDVSMQLWPSLRDGNWLQDIFQDKKSVKYWTHCFERTYAGKIDTWDYQFGFICWVQGRLCIQPNTNIVSNIGFGTGGTHTTGVNSPFANIPTIPMRFPLKHPPILIRDDVADHILQKTHFETETWISKIRYILGHMLGRI
ncbi:MAG: hypothetical protein WCX22_03035 [Methanoregula sp.]